MLRSVGEGGMGEVFEIRGDALGNRLALKLLQAELLAHPKIVQRFEREGRLQASLNHRAIGRVFDLVHYEGRPGLVMEYIEGPTLRAWMDLEQPPPDDVRVVAISLLQGLVSAHKADVVHRDIKPDNVFIVGSGPTLASKLIDFGIAKSMDASEDAKLPTLTLADEYLGTYAYSSPEQLMGSSTVDPRTDLFSVGVLLWEALSGLRPWPGATALVHVMSAVLNDPLPDLPEDAPDERRRLVVELTRKDRDERPQTAAEALGMLQGPAPDLLSATAFPRDEEDAATELLVAAVREDRPTEVVPPAQTTPAVATPAQTTPVQTTPTLMQRVRANLTDQAAPLLLLALCIPAYPIWMLLRGLNDGQTRGQKREGLRVVDAETGQRISAERLFVRNAVDVMVLSGPFAVSVYPPFVMASAGLSLLGLGWVGFVVAMEVGMHQAGDGRRLLDQLLSLRVVLDP